MSRITDIAKTMKTWWSEDDDTFVHRALDEIIRIDQEQASSIEPKKGKWILHPDDLFPAESTMECSVCHEHEFFSLCNENFCPNCGADMRGEGDE